MQENVERSKGASGNIDPALSSGSDIPYFLSMRYYYDYSLFCRAPYTYLFVNVFMCSSFYQSSLVSLSPC